MPGEHLGEKHRTIDADDSPQHALVARIYAVKTPARRPNSSYLRRSWRPEQLADLAGYLSHNSGRTSGLSMMTEKGYNL